MLEPAATKLLAHLGPTPNHNDLSGGQQQRLWIARAITNQLQVLLMDEPCSALDPGLTALIEIFVDQLRLDYTIVIVTHNMPQPARISQRVAFCPAGNLMEAGDTKDIFMFPKTVCCSAFVSGRYG